MDRTLLGIGAAFASALLLVGLSFSRSVDGPADFRFVNGTEPKTLDPQRATGQPEGRVADAIFEGLTRYDEKTHEAVPGMARSWEVSPDGKLYTFHLRDDARWTDGHPVTAHDFVYAWKRLLDPKLGSEYAYLIFAVKHAEALSTYDGHADNLSTKVAADLTKALAGPGLSGDEWQALLAKSGAHDSLKTEADPELTELLARQTGQVTKEELSWTRQTASRVAARLRREAAAARAHFGVDGGAFARGDHTFLVELRAPTPYFLDLTNFYPTFPVPRWVVEAPGRAEDWFLPEHVVSNGPYRLARWKVNDRIRLERSESYWGKSDVRMASVDVLPTENVTTSLNMYLTGEIDWLPDNYPKDLTDELKRRSDFYSNPALIVYYYRLNTTKPPFHDARVRQAVNLAVDRRVIVEDILGLGQIPAHTFVPPGIPGYTAPESGIAHDVGKAKRLLAEAGFPDGRGFPEVGILYNTSENHKKVAEVIADQLRRALGIKVTAYNQEWQSYQDAMRTYRYDMARAGWVGDYTDPNTFLDLWVTNGGNNQTGFASPVYDRLLRAAGDVSAFADAPEGLLGEVRGADAIRAELASLRQGTTDSRLAAQARLRMLLFREAESILVRDEFPVMPLYFYVVSGLVHPRVRGFYSKLEHPDGSRTPNLKDVHPLRGMWVEGDRKQP